MMQEQMISKENNNKNNKSKQTSVEWNNHTSV
jgi:hypothetical protein